VNTLCVLLTHVYHCHQTSDGKDKGR